MKTIKYFLPLLLIAAFPASAASVYECVDKNGQRIYTQNPGSSCNKTDLGRPAVYTSVPATIVPTRPSSDTPEKNTDHALSAEIRAAQKLLDQAKKNLVEGKQVRYGNERNYVKYQERIQGLEKAVSEAQKKLDGLKNSAADDVSSAETLK
ncbi:MULTISPECIES: DUF4124 domain-containing protein [unclassified Neisseria]|uniref:DUF4124 domain-containing protein n=1 Tax=unclassified Neisseria TaxID=2623750 RepID=UPI0026654B9A|nr:MULTISPECIES: DUF4124 domain-containing protein [unclassified Neisseria]MDO1509142.1 DUF4124 domain-containing protein [Neisseria sp. MVDL19-042950]MDO1515579.1 DUF4124 domain-containing protein [Neisseria sp. MVDL18-041461]MDO1562938.1 DUF4124 domain-containing protein [Neisseria sp. MVDL20-010259]